MTTALNIPTIDLAPFMADAGAVIGSEPTPGQLKVARQIDEACRHHGFVYVTNFGLSSGLHQSMFEVASELFHMPDKADKLPRINPETNMGYSPLQSESLNGSRPPELKEAFNIRFPPVHSNMLEACPASFQSMVPELLQVLRKACHRYGMACALALQLPVDFFLQTLTDMNLCTVRFLHAPPCDWSDSDRQGNDLLKAIRVGEHTDFGAYTFVLYPPGAGADGLQIKSVPGGEVGGTAGGEQEGWQTVVLPADKNVAGAIVNTGALMARWTNDEWRATAHRVVVPSADLAKQDRFSVAFFVDPDCNSIVQVHDRFCQNGNECKYEPIASMDYLKGKLREMMSQ